MQQSEVQWDKVCLYLSDVAQVEQLDTEVGILTELNMIPKIILVTIETTSL